MSRDRYYFGDIISHTPEGPVVDRMAMVIQRRQSMDRKRKYVFQLIGCPYCGELHTHSDGTGYRVPHCPDRKPDRANTGSWRPTSRSCRPTPRIPARSVARVRPGTKHTSKGARWRPTPDPSIL